jgi:hypothetical protein
MLDGVKRLCRHLVAAGNDHMGVAASLCDEIKTLIRSSKAPPPLRYQLGIPSGWPIISEEEQQPHEENDMEDQLEDTDNTINQGYSSIQLSQMFQPPQQQLHRRLPHQQYQFPSAPPEITLLPQQQREQYALSIVPRHTRAEINQFMSWSSQPVNTERSMRCG